MNNLSPLADDDPRKTVTRKQLAQIREGERMQSQMGIALAAIFVLAVVLLCGSIPVLLWCRK